MDSSQPVTGASVPATVSPTPAPKSLGGWLASNTAPLAVVAAFVGLIVYKGLIVWDVVLAALGLGLVIFIHELGHFLAAKFCDVHVETFSIGFGKPLPGCAFKYGETTYKIGWLPLGGYVKMVGEGDNADTEEAEEDPRSFKNKSVGQRMLIISAGVVMNLILGCACFMSAYSHGVEEEPAVVGSVGIGSPAWQEDMRIGTRIVQIGNVTKPTFNDVKPAVMSTAKGDTVLFKLQSPAGGERDAYLKPRKLPGDLYPMVGISPIDQLTLQKGRSFSATMRGSSAAAATANDGSHLQGGDRIIETSHDPANPADVRPLSLIDEKPSAQEFLRRQWQMRGKDFHIHVAREEKVLHFVLAPAWTKTLPGVRFQMGRVAAVRVNGPAATAKVIEGDTENGLQPAKGDELSLGDKIIAVEIEDASGKKVKYADEPAAGEIAIDPIRLPHEIEMWAERARNLTVRITVLRENAGPEKKGKRVVLEATWNPELAFTGEVPSGAYTPTALSGLGLAYYVDPVIDGVEPGSAAANAGLKKGDVITDVQFKDLDEKGEMKEEKWQPVKAAQAVFLHSSFQVLSVPDVKLKVKQGGTTDIEVELTVVPDLTWPAVNRGLRFPFDTHVQKADDLGEALGMGLHRTWRTVKVIYLTLYATIFREISTDTLSGPLSIANASYKIVNYDFWQFIVFIGLININLAIVNFLPIPVLDGGHMVFLLYEKIRGKPAPDKLVEWSLYVGVALILALMVFVISLDVRRLFF